MEVCPFLPEISRRFTHDDIHDLGARRDQEFYFTALSYAQSLWLDGYPAKSLLLVNRALSCHLRDISLLSSTVIRPPFTGPTAPYHAKAWIMHYRPADKFIGNPRRHYQHLATRMVEPHKELRSWRAWACWYLAKELLHENEFPADTHQVRQEVIVEPTRGMIAEQLKRWSPADDLAAWEDAIAMVHGWTRKPAPGPLPSISIRLIATDELPIVRELAHEIWHAAYPGIISAEQIHYMLERMYSPDELRQEMTVRGVNYALVESNGVPCGYMAWEMVPNDRSIFLHKLYVRPHLHGRGAGAASLQWLETHAREEHATCIRLRVNRNNHRAIRAYLRAGFIFGHDLCSEIGGGFVMDDHVMVKSL